MPKTIFIVSDTHLTSVFDQKKFDYLLQLFQKCDQLIILGDFWSYYSTTFDQFIHSKWSGLFPLMLEKHTIYIYGNHDREEWVDSRVNLFSEHAAYSYELDIPNKNLHLEHGHFIAGDSIYKYGYVDLIRITQFDRFVYFVDGVALKIFGRGYYSSFGKRLNSIYKKYAQNLNGKILVTGHSHTPEIDLESNFLNSGFVLFGAVSYIKIVGDDITLEIENY